MKNLYLCFSIVLVLTNSCSDQSSKRDGGTLSFGPPYSWSLEDYLSHAQYAVLGSVKDVRTTTWSELATPAVPDDVWLVCDQFRVATIETHSSVVRQLDSNVAVPEWGGELLNYSEDCQLVSGFSGRLYNFGVYEQALFFADDDSYLSRPWTVGMLEVANSRVRVPASKTECHVAFEMDVNEFLDAVRSGEYSPILAHDSPPCPTPDAGTTDTPDGNDGG